MDDKSQQNAKNIEGKRSPEQIAEERILKWISESTGPNVTWLWGASGAEHLELVGHPLDLGNLGLKTVPKSLRNLRDLKVLDLRHNQLQELPSWIGDLTNLIAINISQNQLKTFPTEIGKLSNLFFMIAEENGLERLPDSLASLWKGRKVSRSPGILALYGNPALSLPQSLLGNRPENILQFYYETRGKKGSPLLELKLLFVGRGRAGKTTLAKRLSNVEPDENELETHSISIRDLTLKCPSGNVRTRAWDFGGQEILHSTHQFFLTERSLYMLVLEPRSGLAQRDAEYWLKLIETQGASSPTIVIMNWSHERRWRVDEVRLRRKFPFIVDFLATDALFGEGVEELRSRIVSTVENKMPDVWLPFPRRWREIKDAVAGMDDNFLTYGQYTDLCQKCDEKDPVAQADLAAILHSLGLALYFGEDPRLHDTRVLNPGWVTGGVYAVIRSSFVAMNDGQLTVTDMPRVLQEAENRQVIKTLDYPSETHGFILELMRAFQLCYANEETSNPIHYLVPELLPEFEPEMNEPWEKAPLRLRYRYEVLPPGLLTRFIVRTHAFSEGAPHWRHGVVLCHGEAKALLRAESERQELQIFIICGDEETRRVLVTMVRRELASLHLEMKRQPIEELELTGEAEQWISVKALREIEKKEAPKQMLAVQPEGTAEVNVTRELDKLVSAETRLIDRDPSAAPKAVRVFVSYAHEDERQLKRLDAILDVLEQQYGLTSWTDKRLIAGDEWDKEIRQRLEEMDIFFFIASQASLVSPYVKDPELKRAKERHRAGEIETVVVKLEPCACDEDAFFGKFQRLAPKFRSVAEAPLKSAVWEQVRKDLLPVIKRVRGIKRSVM